MKPSLGLSPAEVADVAGAAIAGGAAFVKDDEILGDPAWCPLDERVRAVAKVLAPGVVYCPNITGPSSTLAGRARRVVDLEVTGLLVNALALGLDGLIASGGLTWGVPILARRAGSGPCSRSEWFGATDAVLAKWCRLCGADYGIVGAVPGGTVRFGGGGVGQP